jgi:peroxiredoxin
LRYVLSALILITLCFPAVHPQGVSYPDPAPGNLAPDFSLPFAGRDSVGFGTVSLSQFTGKKIVVLAFYPADWSGGCTREMCTLRDNFEALAGPDVEVLGISGDTPYSHHEWAREHNLPFLLLSDLKHAVAPAYHSYNQSTGYTRRTAFIIGRDGRFAYVDLEYSTKDLASFEKLQEALSAINP